MKNVKQPSVAGRGSRSRATDAPLSGRGAAPATGTARVRYALRFGGFGVTNASRPTRERFSTVDYSNRTNFGLQTSRRSPRVRRATTEGHDARPRAPDTTYVRPYRMMSPCGDRRGAPRAHTDCKVLTRAHKAERTR